MKHINCSITGIPTYAYSTDDIIITVNDSKGGSVSNRFALNIELPLPTNTPIPTATGTFLPEEDEIYD